MPRTRKPGKAKKRPKVILMPPIVKGSIDPARIRAAVIAVHDRHRQAEAKARAEAKAKANGVAKPGEFE